MVRDFKSSDEGMTVMTADGDEVGMVERVAGSRAHIKPSASLDRSTRRRLGWTEEGEETYQLQKSKVQKIDDDGIHLKKNL